MLQHTNKLFFSYTIEVIHCALSLKGCTWACLQALLERIFARMFVMLFLNVCYCKCEIVKNMG